MIKETIKYVYRGICNILITLLIILEFGMIWYKYLNRLQYDEYLNKGNLLMILVYIVLSIFFLKTMGGLKIGIIKRDNIILGQILGMLCVNLVEIVITILIVGKVSSIGVIIGRYMELWIIECITVTSLSAILIQVYQMNFPPYHMLHIYGETRNNLAIKINSRSDKYIISKELSCTEPLNYISEKIREYDAVIINDVQSEKRNELLNICYAEKKRVYFTPDISDIIVKNSDELRLFDTPIFLCRNLDLLFMQKLIKRLGDILISLIGIIITSPIMAITAILIYLYDRGPILYRQTRCTINGKKFEILKFRSMVIDAEKDGKARLAEGNDKRITPIGRFIRAARIDELPQFFNILYGDMSVVGPRPERPEIIDEYCSEIPEFTYRMRVKAGLTGYAQVFGKYNTTSYDKLKYDMIYVEKCSVLLDIKIIIMTIKVIFQKESTEGVEEGKLTASLKK